MNLKTIINILPFVGLLVMVLWGFLGNAWKTHLEMIRSIKGNNHE